MTKEGSTKIVNFMTPRAGVLLRGRGHKSNIVKMHYFFIRTFFNTKSYIRQTESIVMMITEGHTKIVNCITPGAGVLVLGRGSIVKCTISSVLFHTGAWIR